MYVLLCLVESCLVDFSVVILPLLLLGEDLLKVVVQDLNFMLLVSLSLIELVLEGLDGSAEKVRVFIVELLNLIELTTEALSVVGIRVVL